MRRLREMADGFREGMEGERYQQGERLQNHRMTTGIHFYCNTAYM